MSSFIPCNRVVKETINVGLEDRTTNQKVIFNNENNVYRGHFVGDAVLRGTAEGNSTIENYELIGSTLSGCYFIDNRGKSVQLSDFCGETVSSLQDLSNYIEILSSRIDGPISEFEYETISANDGLSIIWDPEYYRGTIQQEDKMKDVLSCLRYIYQTLGNWSFVDAGESFPEDR